MYWKEKKCENSVAQIEVGLREKSKPLLFRLDLRLAILDRAEKDLGDFAVLAGLLSLAELDFLVGCLAMLGAMLEALSTEYLRFN